MVAGHGLGNGGVVEGFVVVLQYVEDGLEELQWWRVISADLVGAKLVR